MSVNEKYITPPKNEGAIRRWWIRVTELLNVAIYSNVSGQSVKLPFTIGDSINGTTFEILGNITFDGTGQGWKDEKHSMATATKGASAPSWSQFKDDGAGSTGVFAYSFSASQVQSLYIYFHIQHDYKPAGLALPHIHWQNNGVNTGVVRWGIEYAIAKGFGQEAFGNSTIGFLEQAADGTHQIVEFAEGNTLTGLEPDALVLCRIFRDATHANDTCTDAVFGLFSDIHYEVDRVLTLNRDPDFYA